MSSHLVAGLRVQVFHTVQTGPLGIHYRILDRKDERKEKGRKRKL